MATVNVVKGSADEAILRAQYGDKVNFNYTNANQFAGADRFKTNEMYQNLLGAPTSNAGDLNNYNGVQLQAGGRLSDTQIAQNDFKDAQAGQLKAQTDLYNQQGAEKASKIRQAIATQTQQGNATKQDYTNQMNTAIGTLNSERAKLPGQTTNLSNQASSQGMERAGRTRNALSQMGLLQSGESASQQLLNDTTVSNQINANNLQGQELDTQFGDKISSAQTDLASKVKQINDAIALAQSQGDENALMVLQDAQAKIANAGAQSAVDYNNFAYKTGQDATQNRMNQQQIDTRKIQDALDNVYRQSQADTQARQWQSGFDTQNSQFDRQMAAEQQNQAANRATSAYKTSQPKAVTQSSPTGRTNMDDAIISVQKALSVSSPGNVANDIEQKRDSLSRQGINVDALIKEVWRLSGVQTKPEVQDSWR